MDNCGVGTSLLYKSVFFRLLSNWV